MENDADTTFQAATDHLPSILEKLGNEDLLFFYARFKQATAGPCNVSKPGLFDFQGRKKWNAWHDLGNMPVSQAQAEYVMKMRECDPQWDGAAQKKTVFGRSISRPLNEDNEDEYSNENILFKLCKDGDVDKLKLLSKQDLNIRDNDDRTLLHWACDRGHFQVAKFLLENACDVNAVDNELSTPLHYASLCGYRNIVEILLRNGANTNAADESGDTPLDCAESQEIKELIISSS